MRFVGCMPAKGASRWVMAEQLLCCVLIEAYNCQHHAWFKTASNPAQSSNDKVYQHSYADQASTCADGISPCMLQQGWGSKRATSCTLGSEQQSPPLPS
jgi:hypothetical protein